jgi:hypothetical protein
VLDELTAMAFLVVVPGTRPKLTWNVLKLYTPIVPCFEKSAYHVPRRPGNAVT